MVSNAKRNKLIQIFRAYSIFIAVLLVVSTLKLAHAQSLKMIVAPATQNNEASWWDIQSIDTVKYSRDIAAEKLNDTAFLNVIDSQVKAIASTGATHIALGTPYDAKFRPFLLSWVSAARKYGLKVWFRGNFSGWEEWFGFKPISREEHQKLTKEFILNNGDIFMDGDIFSSCPECENGGPGDPRQTGDVTGFRNFLISEYKDSNEAFRLINRQVKVLNSSNGDVARLVMDKNTTKSLGGIVAIDHYVKTPDKLVKDLLDLSISSGGKVMLGEFGAPIPDIHGKMTEAQQAEWLGAALEKLAQMPQVVGVNYWTHIGSSTQLWDHKLQSTRAVAILTKYYKPLSTKGQVVTELGTSVPYAKVLVNGQTYISDEKGNFIAKYLQDNPVFTARADGYLDKTFKAPGIGGGSDKVFTVTLIKEHEDWIFQFRKKLNAFIDWFLHIGF